MLFKELPKGKIFTFMQKDGHTETAIKIGEHHAITLQSGEEVKIHLTKKIDLPAPMRGGEFAIDDEGRPMIVERMKNGSYACQYIERIGNGVLPEREVSVIQLRKRETGESLNELYIILSRAKKALKTAQNALDMGESVVEELE